jgi:hypothetical protein
MSAPTESNKETEVASALQGLSFVEALNIPAFAELIAPAADFKFNAIEGPAAKSGDASLWDIHVSWRGEDRWAVIYHSKVWNFKKKDWDYESMPSSRTDAFKRNCRASLPVAVAKAIELSKTLTTNGKDPEGFMAWYAKREEERAEKEVADKA